MYYVVFFTFLSLVYSEMVAPGIHRTVSPGVRSKGINFVYGDENMSVINEVVSDLERVEELKPKVNLNEDLPPLPYQDVKCLMSVDRYCSKNMVEMKNILIQALKEDCVKCTQNQKDEAGKIAASMMAHDPVAWKHFLTRSALQILPPKKAIKEEKQRFKKIGKPEYVRSSKNQFKLPGVKVRVKRYAMEKINS